MDRRQQKTREAILEAFGSLLSQKSYAKITVQDIIDGANIGRTTFYAHFETKDALLQDMCTELFAHVFSDPLRTEDTHDFSQQERDPQKVVTHILYHLLDNRRNILGILTGESEEVFLRYFKQHLNELMPQSFFGKIDADAGGVPRDFLVHHLSSSFIATIQWWAGGGLAQPPEEIARYYIDVTMPILGRS